MSEKKYTPYEASLEILKKAQEVYNKHKESKSEVCKDEMDKCGDVKVIDKKEEKKEDLKKLMSGSSTVPGSVATTGGPSIGSQIGFGKSDKKLPEFLKKKKMKKAMGDAPQTAAAPKAPKSGSPQPPSTSLDQGWSNTKKSEDK